MLDRRQFLFSGVSASAFASLVSAQSGNPKGSPHAKSSGQLTLNLVGASYYLGFCPFLNWYKAAGDYSIGRKGGASISGKAAFDGGYVDKSTGEIVKPVPSDVADFSRVVYASVGEHDLSGEQWTVEWDGEGTCTIGGLTSGGSQSTNHILRSGKFKFGNKPGNTWISFKITDPTDPPRNIRLYQTRYAANVARGEKFNPDWLAQVGKFGILRFMDWMATNGSKITDFSQFPTESQAQYNGTPPSLICELANLTHCDIHICIPHLATDACVRSIAEYFRDHVRSEIMITFEYSNECWNFTFPQTQYCLTQARALWAGDGAGYLRWYGLRSAQCMAIVRDVFKLRSRWRGCLATQTVNVAATRYMLEGVDYFKANELSPKNALSITDLFDEISVTGYFGDVQSCRPINSISKSNPAVATSPSHGYKNGQRLKLTIGLGMTELNDKFVTVGNATNDTFEISGIDSTSYTDSVKHDRNYAHPALIFELMDTSQARFMADPKSYPTRYSYFNRVLAESWLSGSSEGFNTFVSVASLRDKFWPAQKAVAEANGLDLRQYEGGLHFVGDVYLTGYGGNPQFTEYLVNSAYTREAAEVYAAMYAAFFQIGGHYPAKYVEAGSATRYGTWGGMRYIPGDEGNPVWTVVRQANERKL